MTDLRVLFIGGSGVISSACAELAVEQGIELTVLNRGADQGPAAAARPRGCGTRTCATRPRSARCWAAPSFDAVVDWVAFTPEHVEADIELFRGRVGQYVFISSASAYQTPPSRMPVTESTPLRNPFWAYSRDKIACEDRLVRAYRDENFPATIVRPSHTYDKTLVPLDGGWTVLGRMRQGKPVIVHGDGTSLWTLTHHRDFAAGFVPLLGHPRTLGEAFHITSDDVLTWNQITEALAAAAGGTADIVHVPSDADRRGRPGLGRRAARRQVALAGVRQQQAAQRGARLPGGHPVRAGRPGDRRLVRRGSRRGSRSTPGWTR